MTQSSIIPYLFLATFIIVLAYGVVQFVKAKKAKREGHTSAAARATGETPASSPASSTVTGTSVQQPTPPTVPR